MILYSKMQREHIQTIENSLIDSKTEKKGKEENRERPQQQHKIEIKENKLAQNI